MKTIRRAAVMAAGFFVVAGIAAAAAVSAPAYVTDAVHDANRPAEDVARDPFRKPIDMMVFAKVHPGERVLELIPAKGYFERIFSKAIGPDGHLYEALPPPMPGAPPDASPKSNGLAMDAHYGNITETVLTPAGVASGAPYDLIWTSQNDHDFHLTRLHTDIPAFNKMLFDALKPGGILVVVDHAAAPGSGTTTTDAMHRIDEATVKTEMKAAGFKLEAESDVLRNPADDHTLKVFDPKIRGHTDQFVLRFRKPKA